jgi:hypothetical protein
VTTHAPAHLPLTPRPTDEERATSNEQRGARASAHSSPLVPRSSGGGEGLLAVFTAGPFLITLALAALWVGLSTVLAFVAQRVFGMDALAAWAYAIGIVSYMYLFTGFVLGLIYLVRKDRERTERA